MDSEGNSQPIWRLSCSQVSQASWFQARVQVPITAETPNEFRVICIMISCDTRFQMSLKVCF